MSKCKTHHLVPNSNGGWDVKKGGRKRSIKHFSTKAAGEKFSQSLSRNQKSEFVIHKKNGRIQRSDSNGGDTYPPKG